MISFGDWISDAPRAQPVNLVLDRYVVTPEFFRLYEIPLASGRIFSASDPFTNVVVSERLASLLWPGLDPLGRTFRIQNTSYQVIGVSREISLPVG